MRIFFDTEFLENGRTIELISIALLREDGATFYVETPEANALASSDDWLKTNVLPHLRGGSFVKSRRYIAEAIRQFAGSSPEFWAYYADYDWVALCQLFGRMIDLPKGWPKICYDFRQWLDFNGKKHIRGPENAPHDALLDAQWLADAFREHGSL